MNWKLVISTITLLSLSVTTPAIALDASSADPQTQSSNPANDSKRNLAEQYLVAAGWDTQIKSAFEKQVEGLSKVSEVTTQLSPVSDQEKARRQLTSQALKEVFLEIDLAKECRDIMLDLLVENFDEAELKSIVDYALSPTGKKTTELMPKIQEEGMKLGEVMYGPKIDKALYEAIQEETNQKVLEK
ncbi:MAG: DUF2059 domain-containing protein [Cyanobacteria bacterium]|nr:DUF2059 domain-containing protein [Cyanobacteriota bacterium]